MTGQGGRLDRLQADTPALLRRLRNRLMSIFAVVAVLVALLTTLVVSVRDTEAARDNQVADVMGQASRAAALVYLDDNGKVAIDGVKDDLVTQEAHGLTVFAKAVAPSAPKVLFTVGRIDNARQAELVGQAVTDAEEKGHAVQYDEAGVRTLAVAMPWWNDDESLGGAVVVTAEVPTLIDSGLLRVALVTSLGGATVLTLLMWFLISRIIRPAEATLADREQFLRTAAHELRAPLARMKAGAEAAHFAVHQGDDARPALRRILTVADEAARVVSNLLLATRIEHRQVPVARERFRLDTLAADLEQVLPGIVVDIDTPVEVEGDTVLVRHAITNLVDNSLRHGRRSADIAPNVTLRVLLRDGAPVVQVDDDGPGLPDGVDVRTRYTIGGTGGTGLGLPLVEWIAAQHGASFHIANRPPGAVEIMSAFDDGESERTASGTRAEIVFPPVPPTGSSPFPQRD